jgi:hypothetical protein
MAAVEPVSGKSRLKAPGGRRHQPRCGGGDPWSCACRGAWAVRWSTVAADHEEGDRQAAPDPHRVGWLHWITSVTNGSPWSCWKRSRGRQPEASPRDRQRWRRQGWTREQVWRKLSELWDDGLIRATREPRDLNDAVGDPSLLIEGLTADGWALYKQLRRPVRFWFERNWKWVIGTVIAVAGIAATILVAP